ncbi:MAG: hypothetical protein HQL87_15790, partial [Magnetococcales bacterium]|nr:hypothetical protein [Magnetococcales bacterium]
MAEHQDIHSQEQQQAMELLNLATQAPVEQQESELIQSRKDETTEHSDLANLQPEAASIEVSKSAKASDASGYSLACSSAYSSAYASECSSGYSSAYASG